MTAGIPAAGQRPADYLEQAEREAGRTLACRDDVVLLFRASGKPERRTDFDRALFLAKFWEGAMGILGRTGPGAEEVQKLTAELVDAASRLSELLTGLVESVEPGAAEDFRRRYFGMDAGSMGRLRNLLSDLSLLKNFELHGVRR